MKARDILPDHINEGQIAGVLVRKGTVAAFLANARTWGNAATPAAEKAEAERDILEALPALRALGLFEVLRPRDEQLRALLQTN